MKKFMRRFFGIAASAALLVTSAMPVFAAHSHSGGMCLNDTTFTTKGANDYTITLSYPQVDGKTYSFKKDVSSFGAYQIFSGTVKGDSHTDPGTDSTSISITNIQWGNAFGDLSSDDTQKKILEFVYALANAPSNPTYGYAFKDFTDFQSFFGNDNKLSSSYTTGEVTVTGSDVTGDLGTVNFDALAIGVADVLAEDTHKNDHEWLQAFTDILGGYAQGITEGSYANEGYVTQYYRGYVGTSSDISELEESAEYTIYVPAGYYLIRDRSAIDESEEKDPSEAFSARMLFVANDVAQTLKVDVPRLEKEILRDSASVGGDVNETDVAGVGDVVHFQLKGSLPSNYDEYLGGYKYNFIDTLSSGLDLSKQDGTVIADESTVEGVTVNVKRLYKWNGTKWEWDSDKSTALTVIPDTASGDRTDLSETSTHLGDSKNYKLSYKGRTLTVEFPCLKEIRIKEGDTVYRLGYNTDTDVSSEIYVDYYAKINQNAVVSPAEKDGSANGNDNQAQIQYSDNPQSYNDTDYTVVDRATVYTFGLDMVKIDAAAFLKNGSYKDHEAEVGLEDAKFALVRSASDQWEIAKFAFIAEDTVSAMDPKPTVASFLKGYYSIVSWEKIVDETGKEVTGTSFDKKWLEISKYKEGADYNITTKENGILNVSGLDAGVTYTMVETAAPDAYAKIDPFTIQLTAVQDDAEEYNGKLSGALSDKEIDADASFSFASPVKITDTFDDSDDGSANMLVANFRYTDLPSTGGVGKVWFYIIGAGSIALSGFLFYLSRKKTTK